MCWAWWFNSSLRACSDWLEASSVQPLGREDIRDRRDLLLGSQLNSDWCTARAPSDSFSPFHLVANLSKTTDELAQNVH